MVRGAAPQAQPAGSSGQRQREEKERAGLDVKAVKDFLAKKQDPAAGPVGAKLLHRR